MKEKNILKQFLIMALFVAVCYSLSWIVTCGVIKAITLCFNWTFKWSIATGIWIILCLLKSVFHHSVTVKTKKKGE